MATVMKIEGALEMQAALLALPEKVSKRIMGKALRAGGEIVLAEARYNAPVKTGATAAGLQIVMSSRGGESVCSVQTASDTYWAKIIDRGFTHVGGKKIPGKHFMEKSLESAHGVATDAIAGKLKEGIEKEAFKE